MDYHVKIITHCFSGSVAGWRALLTTLAAQLLISGCTALALTGAGVGLGVSYTMDNIAYTTVTYPLITVDEATAKALKNMAIQIISHKKSDGLRKFEAATKDLDIRINLERITLKTTKIKVDARKWPVLKDKATATEIVHQIGDVLEGDNSVIGNLRSATVNAQLDFRITNIE